MSQEDREKLLACLTDQTAERFRSGDLRVEIAPPSWPDGWYCDPYWRVSVPLAVQLMSLPAANDFVIYYHRDTDFHRIQFDYDGDTFIIRWYKTFILHRKSDRKHIDFGRREGSISDFMKREKFKESSRWQETSSVSNPFCGIRAN